MEAAVVDLFCGPGGLSYGLRSAGLDVVAGIDNDSACRYPFETNVGATFIHKDVRELTSREVADLYPTGAIRILAGCAPCQPFSSLSNKNKDRGKDDGWRLLAEFSRIVEDLKPEVVSMENVPKLVKADVCQEFLAVLDRLGYSTWFNIVKCEQYGVPQRRRRLVLLASRTGDIKLGPPSHEESKYVTVREVIGHLEPISAGGASAIDHFHRCQGLSKLNLKRIRSSKPGGTWRDWDKSLRTNCHSKESGESYSPVYGRMSWDEPAPTMTGQFYNYGSGRFGHPKQDRPISLREGALLQSFPSNYKFEPEGEISPVSRTARLIGNAVPVKLGEAIGHAISRYVEELHCRIRITNTV